MGLITTKDGYFYDPDGLRQVAGAFRSSVQKVDGVLQAMPTEIDAGASSQDVAKALTLLSRLAAQGTATARDTADKIHATDGSYADVEETNADMFKGWHQPR